MLPAPLPTTPARSNSAPQTRLLITTGATLDQRTTTATVQLLITPARSNSNLITRAPITIGLLRRRPKATRPVLRPTSRWLTNLIQNWPANSRPRILKTTVLRERQDRKSVV